MNKIQIPWEDRPVGCTDVMWRYSQNPVIGRYHIPSSNSILQALVKTVFIGISIMNLFSLKQATQK